MSEPNDVKSIRRKLRETGIWSPAVDAMTDDELLAVVGVAKRMEIPSVTPSALTESNPVESPSEETVELIREVNPQELLSDVPRRASPKRSGLKSEDKTVGPYKRDSPLGAIVHKNVDSIRAQRGLYAWQIQQALGMRHRSDYYRMFWRQPTNGDLEALAEVLGVTVNDLLRSE